MSKKKVNIKVLPGQAVFVADVSILEHIAQVYESMSFEERSQEDKQAWLNVSLSIKDWIDRTYVPEEEQYEEEW
jgi:hypothetical protein